MKQYLLLILAFIFVDASIAQITYESPHVKDGKTLQLIIPEGYFEITDVDEIGVSMYSTVEGLDMEEDEEEALEAGVIFLMHMPTEGETLTTMKEMMEDKMDESSDEMTILQKPQIVNVNGRDCMQAEFKGEVINGMEGTTYFNIVVFGDYFILLTYYGADSAKERMNFEKFNGIMSSSKEVETTKEDALEAAMEEEYAAFEDETDYEDYAIYFPNDVFETKLTYYDVLPDFGGNWDDYIDDSGHLLSMFSYKKDSGFIKVFSGGLAAKYPSEEEMASAIQKATDWTKTMTLVFNTQFSNEDHVFRLYTISGGGTMTSVYTTVVGDELVFFVVDGGSNPVDDFKPAVRDFMLTMWVDYFEEEE